MVQSLRSLIVTKTLNMTSWSSEDVYDDIYKKAKEQGDEILKQLGEMLDEHLDWEGDDSKQGGQSGAPANGDGGENGKESKSQPVYSKEDLKKIKDEIKENMISAAQTSGAGNVPGEVARMIKELTEPKMNWRELLFVNKFKVQLEVIIHLLVLHVKDK